MRLLVFGILEIVSGWGVVSSVVVAIIEDVVFTWLSSEVETKLQKHHVCELVLLAM